MSKLYTQYGSQNDAFNAVGDSLKFISPDHRVYESVCLVVEHGTVEISPEVMNALLDLKFAIEEADGKYDFGTSFAELSARADEFTKAYKKVRDLLRRENGKI